MDIRMLLIPQQLKTYSQVLTIARDVERGLEKKNQNQIQNKPMKRPFQQMDRDYLVMEREGSVRPSDDSLAK